MVELPAEFRSKPRSYYVWSRSRRAGHALALTLGSFADPSFRWISVRESATQQAEEEAWVYRLLPVSRVLAPLTSAELRPGPQVSRETFDALVRPDGATEDRTTLDHYLRLPPRLQGLLHEDEATTGPRFIVVANSDRIRQLYPIDPGRLRPFTRVFSRSGLSLVTTSIPPPYEGRYAFDIVFRLDVDSAEEWRAGPLIVEKGLGSGEFRTGATFPITELSGYLQTATEIERAMT